MFERDFYNPTIFRLHPPLVVMNSGTRLRYNGLSSGEHYWRVEVTHQLKATLLQEGGDPIPEWVRCAMEAPIQAATW